MSDDYETPKESDAAILAQIAAMPERPPLDDENPDQQARMAARIARAKWKRQRDIFLDLGDFEDREVMQPMEALREWFLDRLGRPALKASTHLALHGEWLYINLAYATPAQEEWQRALGTPGEFARSILIECPQEAEAAQALCALVLRAARKLGLAVQDHPRRSAVALLGLPGRKA
jgi:hypothetical protein